MGELPEEEGREEASGWWVKGEVTADGEPAKQSAERLGEEVGDHE